MVAIGEFENRGRETTGKVGRLHVGAHDRRGRFIGQSIQIADGTAIAFAPDFHGEVHRYLIGDGFRMQRDIHGERVMQCSADAVAIGIGLIGVVIIGHLSQSVADR